MNDRASERKYKITLLVLTISTALVATDKLTGSLWVNVVSTITGLYFAANVVQKNVRVNLGKAGEEERGSRS